MILKKVRGKTNTFTKVSGIFLAINLGIVSPRRKMIKAITIEMINETAISPKYGESKSTKRKVERTDMKIAQTLFPISTVIRVESNRSIRETISLAFRSFSLAKALYLYLLTQAKAVSAPEKNAVNRTATTRRMILSHKGMSNSDFPPNNHTYKKPLFIDKGAFVWVLIFV